MIVAATSRKLLRSAKITSSSAPLNGQMIIEQIAKGVSIRHLTLPPGSVRGYPSSFRGQTDGYQSDINTDDDSLYQSDSRSRVQVSMTPKGRCYGTALEVAQHETTVTYPVSNTAIEEESYDYEGYDDWDMHSPVAGQTRDDLGSIISDEYDFAMERSLLLDNTSATTTEISDDAILKELKEYMTTVYEGGMGTDENDYSTR